MNSRFQNAVTQKLQTTPPVWMMRQAGRYHRHYQALRKKHGFMELCKNAELAAQVALGPIQDFDFDVSILFSDLLFPLEALGMGLDYDLGPPRLSFSLDVDSVRKLRAPEQAIRFLEFQRDAVRRTRELLPQNKSLIGFVGGPWTLLGYAVDGSHQGGLRKTHEKAPQLLPAFFEKLIPLLILNIQLQFEGGAETVMILDTAAGEMTASDWKTWVLPSLRTLSAAYPARLGYYMRGASEEHWSILNSASLPLAGIGFDATLSLSQALSRRRSGFVQGNFHQEHMTLPESDFLKKFEEWIRPILSLSEEERRGWICGVGHGLTPHAKESNVRKFVELVRERFA